MQSLIHVQGHWCAAIGHVKILVQGPITCQDFIAASLSHPAAGQRADPTDASMLQRVVAFALEDKPTESSGHVQAFVLFGLGAIAALGSSSAAAVAAQLHSLKQVFLQTDADLKVDHNLFALLLHCPEQNSELRSCT